MTVVDKAERLADLVALLLHTRRPLRVDEIVGEMHEAYPDDRESARVQFERDKAALREADVELAITGEGDERGYRIDRTTFELPDLGLDEDEALALNLALTAVRIEGIDVAGAVWKLGLDPDPSPPLVAITANDSLAVLQSAASAHATVRFRYRAVERVVEPYGLLSREGWWYVVGFDRTRAEQRVFRVDRIEGEVVAGEGGEFEVPETFDLASALADLAFELAPGEGVDARVLVDAAVAERVVAELGDERVGARRGDGSVVVVVRVTHRRGFVSWLLGLLDHARVLEPPELVDQVVDRLREMAS